MSQLSATEKTRIRRGPKRAVFEREVLEQVFTQAYVAHVGFIQNDASGQGQPFVIPMLCWVDGDLLYVHGASSSRMIKALTNGSESCVTATILDGMVLSKSAFHHSANYRSAMVFGQFFLIEDPQEIDRQYKTFMEKIAPGRWNEVRPPSEIELKATKMLAIKLDQASVKVRSGGPNEDKEDLDIPAWTGEMVIKHPVTTMVADQHSTDGIKAPDYSEAWKERWWV